MSTPVDVLIPTCRRPAALAVTLAGIAAQGHDALRVVISDQTPDGDPLGTGEVRAVVRILRARGIAVAAHKHLPHRGMAEQRQFLLDCARSPYALFLDDDIWLEPDLIGRMLGVLQSEGCGFVGCAVIGTSFLGDVRPDEQAIAFWDGPVRPEEIHPGTAAWDRYRLHNAANLYHLQQQLGLTGATQRTYKVAWVGGCVLYDVAKLRAVGGFGFWCDLPPEHCGEDVLAQQRVMARFGGCGLIPSGAYHLELPTTIADRRVDAPQVLRAGKPLAPRVSVVMPVGDGDASSLGSLESLGAQALTAWELIVMDRGMAEATRAALTSFLADPRVRYYRLGRNRSLAAALNEGLERARAPLVAYLLPGGRFAPDHLATLAQALWEDPGAIVASSGIRDGEHSESSGIEAGGLVSLLQVMHRQVGDARSVVGLLTGSQSCLPGQSIRTGRVTAIWRGSPKPSRPKGLAGPFDSDAAGFDSSGRGGPDASRTPDAHREASP